MAVTLAQSAVLCQDKLVKGIMEELVRTSPLLSKLPFIDIVGNALAINREDPANTGSVDFYNVGDAWNESTAQFVQTTFSLTTLGGDADVPNLIRKTRSNINDQLAAQIKLKTKLMGHAFEEEAVYGTGAAPGFPGLHSLVESDMQVHCGSGTTGGALSLLQLDEAIDMVAAYGKPDIILMNRVIHRRLNQYLRTVGSYETERDEYGHYFTVWQGIPIVVTDFINQTEAIANGAYSAATGGDTSSVFVVKFGEGEGLVGIQNGGIQTEIFERLESYDSTRVRIKWYVGLALFSTRAVARIDGITNDAVTA